MHLLMPNLIYGVLKMGLEIWDNQIVRNIVRNRNYIFLDTFIRRNLLWQRMVAADLVYLEQ